MATRTPRLLVSVRDAREAEEALAGGADWIDLKEPRNGPLGAATACAARAVVARVGGRAPVSAAGGELADWRTAAARELLAVSGLSHLKLGLADCRGKPWETWWRAAQREAAEAGKQLVIVAYADYATARAPCPADVMRCAARANAAWALVDTFDKTAGALGDHWSSDELRFFLAGMRAAGCSAAVAGGLDGEAISRLPWDLVDMAAVRGAACRGPREGSVCRERVAALARTARASAAAGARARRAVCQESPTAFFERPRISLTGEVDPRY